MSDEEWNDDKREAFRKAHEAMAAEADGIQAGGIFDAPGVSGQRVATPAQEEIESQRQKRADKPDSSGAYRKEIERLAKQEPSPRRATSVVDVAILCVLIVIAVTLMYFVWGHH